MRSRKVARQERPLVCMGHAQFQRCRGRSEGLEHPPLGLSRSEQLDQEAIRGACDFPRAVYARFRLGGGGSPFEREGPVNPGSDIHWVNFAFDSVTTHLHARVFWSMILADSSGLLMTGSIPSATTRPLNSGS